MAVERAMATGEEKACAPYLHHRLSAIQRKIPDRPPDEVEADEGDHELPDFRRPN